jgi:hypothetical protein
MSKEAGKGFTVSEELAVQTGRGFHSGSGIGGYLERNERDAIKKHLGIGDSNITSPEQELVGILLIGYVAASTRLRGIKEGQTEEYIKGQIRVNLMTDPEETPQKTFERLLEVAKLNSYEINDGSY